MKMKSFIVVLESEDFDLDSIDLFAHLSGEWDGVYVTLSEAAQPTELCDHGKKYGECEILGCGHCYETRRL